MDGLSRTKHWALSAVVAALCSFVYAKAPAMNHFGGSSHGGFHPGGGGGWPGRGRDMRGVGRVDVRSAPRAYAAQRPHGAPPNRDAGLSRGAATIGQRYPDGYGYAAGRPGGPAYAAENHGIQYAGAITPVSTESHSVPRPPGNAPVRAGSIRADITRYNEERGGPRAMPRPADEGRPPEGNPYRN